LLFFNFLQFEIDPTIYLEPSRMSVQTPINNGNAYGTQSQGHVPIKLLDP